VLIVIPVGTDDEVGVTPLMTEEISVTESVEDRVRALEIGVSSQALMMKVSPSQRTGSTSETVIVAN
jgi:hypothetical protein